MIDVRQSLQYANYLSSLGWTVERVDGINYFTRRLPLIGSILKIQRPEKINYQFIDKLEKKYKVFQTIIEPNIGSDIQPLITNGYRLSKSSYLPSKTLQIDLTRSKDKIYANFTKDCKYNIKRGDNVKVKEYSTSKYIENWREAWKNYVKFTRYVPPAEQLINLRKSFPGNYSLFLASHNISGRIIGGALFTRSLHDIGYYWYGFTNYEGRTSLSQYSLLYQGILWAKKIGCKVFDLEGIYDVRFPNKSWLGFSHFKKSFGGTEVSYPGCYTKLSLLNSLGRI